MQLRASVEDAPPRSSSISGWGMTTEQWLENAVWGSGDMGSLHAITVLRDQTGMRSAISGGAKIVSVRQRSSVEADTRDWIPAIIIF